MLMNSETAISFQSLFLWNDLFNTVSHNPLRLLCAVSILVFMERPLQQHREHRQPGPLRVSILVFMERPLQHYVGGVGGDDRATFQSLFLWNDLFNGIRLKNSIRTAYVSILVFMERPLQQLRYLSPRYDVFLFQSLFLWNDLFHAPRLWLSSHPQSCFNPCFYGTTSSTKWDVLVFMKGYGVSILVFME